MTIILYERMEGASAISKEAILGGLEFRSIENHSIELEDYYIKDYITGCKINIAKDLLKNSKLPVYMISLELGYSNFSYFVQLFKQMEDMTPLEYREMHKKVCAGAHTRAESGCRQATLYFSRECASSAERLFYTIGNEISYRIRKGREMPESVSTSPCLSSSQDLY